ncbi:MAG TPA: serine acetyltransferase [Myxococcales bacterium]|nr:serine acetyltransferase [Myxococcales bacterium]
MATRSEKKDSARSRAGEDGARARLAGVRPSGEGCSPDVIEEAVRGLSGCSENALSQAVCRGIVDPQKVVDWANRTERLLRFQFDRSELRSEIPVVAERLHALLGAVDLPTSSTPESITSAFVGSLVGLRELIAEDVAAAFAGDPAATGYDEIAVAYPAIRALSVHRIAHELYLRQVPLIPRIMSEYAHDRTGIDIHPGARIGRHFFIDHGTGVVIGETTVIGDHVRIYQGVTLGARSIKESASLRGVKRHPTVENDVTIYAGAKILGGETVIGAGSVVGGNVWLTESVPPGSHVLIDPPHNVVSQDVVSQDVVSRDERAPTLPFQLPWED